ncbi:MAG: leucyl aminopeptidase [Chloroflexi bacterium RBG_13_46_14]|nr:MAG: leucyl aminopeptidase [Chloroflexi bacterium RBG_13_46_14]
MEIKIASGNIREVEADAIILYLFEGTDHLEGDLAEIDSALEGVISRLLDSGEIKGKLGQVTIIHTLGKLPGSRVVICGLGKEDELSLDSIRKAAAEACRSLEQNNVETIATVIFGNNKIPADKSGQAMTEGALLGTYSFRRHITKEAEHGNIRQLTILANNDNMISEIESGYVKGQIIAEATMNARNMVNEPANYMTPSDMAVKARQTGDETDLEVEILEKEDMQELGMGALLGVARGSEQPPKFIIMKYTGRKTTDIEIALIGKAITFDSGGISIKPSAGMEEMKDDMSGGAAVIAAMGAIARLKPEINVLGLVPATENLPNGNALKPGDVITQMEGKTIEIISTDAEGRLALSDAIGYARKQGVRQIVDVATLTGAMQVALGDVCTGAFANNQELADKVIAAGEEAGERIWQMPMYDEYKEQNKSDVADIKNVGGRLAGSITAALFLGEFVGDVPWVHLDIAGTAYTDKTKGYKVKGATGVPVRTLVNLVLSLVD